MCLVSVFRHIDVVIADDPLTATRNDTTHFSVCFVKSVFMLLLRRRCVTGKTFQFCKTSSTVMATFEPGHFFTAYRLVDNSVGPAPEIFAQLQIQIQVKCKHLPCGVPVCVCVCAKVGVSVVACIPDSSCYCSDPH